MDAGLVVIFRSRLRPDTSALHEQLMVEVEAALPRNPGIVSHKTFVADDDERVTIVELLDDASLRQWAADPAHRAAKDRADDLYEHFDVTVATLTSEG